jgi:hypothetical protein
VVPVGVRRVSIAALLLLCATRAGAAPDVRAKVLAAYASVKSYRIAVLGSVRSTGTFVAPDRYKMTTVIDGKPLKTIFVGKTYWIYTDGKWQKSDTAANSLDFDIFGLVRAAKTAPASSFVALPGQVVNGKPLGAFKFTFKNGSEETCNYDPATYLATRCKAEDLTILYSGYNDPSITIPTP